MVSAIGRAAGVETKEWRLYGAKRARGGEGSCQVGESAAAQTRQ
jgi:hypothetical protein